MRIGVVGLGHVGLPTAVTLAHLGHDVAGTDSDGERVARLREGIPPFFEAGLEELVRAGLDSGRLAFTSAPQEAVAGVDVVFICVGTPPKATGEANMAAVEKAARTIAGHASGPLVVAEKSTVPAGTAIRLQQVFERAGFGSEIDVVSNPEFLREGAAIEDSLAPTRVLVGAESARAFEVMRRVYAPLADKGIPLIESNIATAELAKHACNAFLALKISFANALARLCELSDADVVRVADVMGSDPRIGRAFLDAGLGYGGYCFPKDLQAFERLAATLGYDFALLREVGRINDEAVEHAAKKIENAVWNLDDKRIALLGLSFKPGTDDTRFAPALALAQRLIGSGARVVGYDPSAGANAAREVPELLLAGDPYAAAEGAACLVICTDWDEFAKLDLPRLKEVMVDPIIVDGRNVIDPEDAVQAGFSYHPTGRPRPS